MAHYEKYPQGSTVRIASREALERFAKDWKWHHPLQDSQIEDADRVAKVADVGYYHGGDVLYKLDGIQGTWHEENLSPADW